MIEGGARDTEILGQHLVRRVLQPVAQQERIVLVEVTVVEDQEEFAAVRIETLDRMRDTRWKIPEIADTNVINEVVSLLVDGRDASAAVKHVGPFGLLVPMQFANAAGIQAHVHAGDVLGNAEFSQRDLTGPAAGVSRMGCVPRTLTRCSIKVRRSPRKPRAE